MNDPHLARSVAVALRELGRLYQESGDTERAADAYGRAIAILQQVGEPGILLDSLVTPPEVLRPGEGRRERFP